MLRPETNGILPLHPAGRDVGPNSRGLTPAEYHALTTAALAGNESGLIDRIVDLSCERDVYRELAQEGIQQLASVTTKLKQVTERYYQLLDEYRQMRSGGGR